MKLPTALFFLIATLNKQALSQMRTEINYLDQRPPGDKAQIFAPGLLTTDALEHSAPAFSPDGKTVLWTVMKIPSYQTCLLEMNFINDQWSAPHSPTFSDTTVNEVCPTFSKNGDSLFFSTNRKTHPLVDATNTLWYVVRTDTGWTKARLLDTLLFPRDVYANSIADNGSRYFIIGPQGTQDWNMFYLKAGGKIQRLPAPMNTSGYEDGPFIAADESYLIFESDRPVNGVQGNLDLYISFRGKDGRWNTPLNMGSKINTKFSERFARVSPDGKYLFFGRNTGRGFDIYWIDASIIEELKKQAP